MDIRKTMGSQKYLKSLDLNGSVAVVTIAGVALEMVGQGKDVEEKAVLSFTGKEKTLVLNSINKTTIGEAFGWETQPWEGKSIELYPTTTDFAGKIVPCIRVRIPVVAPAVETVAVTSAAAAVEDGDDIPF